MLTTHQNNQNSLRMHSQCNDELASRYLSSIGMMKILILYTLQLCNGVDIPKSVSSAGDVFVSNDFVRNETSKLKTPKNCLVVCFGLD